LGSEDKGDAARKVQSVGFAGVRAVTSA